MTYPAINQALVDSQLFTIGHKQIIQVPIGRIRQFEMTNTNPAVCLVVFVWVN